MGIRGVVVTPILVEGRLWGAMGAGTAQDEPLPPETESRLGQFTDLVATAIANTESRAKAERLAEEQAALRRVATLVAQEAPPAEVFAKVAEEVARTCSMTSSRLLSRDEGDGTASAVAVPGRRRRGRVPGRDAAAARRRLRYRGRAPRRPAAADRGLLAAAGTIAERAHRPRDPLGGRLPDPRRLATWGA